MKKLAIAAAVALLAGGCASAPKPSVMAPKKKAPLVRVAPVEQPTPNQQVKARWYDRFKVHPKWFNK